MSPAWLVAPLVALILALVAYALYPHRRRSFLSILLACALGVGLGQGWQWLELPSLHLGEANLLPAALFALALQPLAGRVPINLPSRADGEV